MGGITTTLFQRPRDPNFNQTTLLLSGNFPTNGAQNNTFLDSSSNGFTITRNPSTGPNAPTQGTFSPFSQTGWSNYFDGVSTNYLSLASSADFAVGTTFTFECWIYPTVSPPAGGQNIFGNTASGQFSVGYNGSTAWGIAALGTAWRLTTSTMPTVNAWNHIVVARSGTGTNQTSLFLNGVRVANGTVTDAFTTSGAANIGMLSSLAFTGYISNLRLVKGTDVYGTGNVSLTVPTAPITPITNTVLLTCQSNCFIDTNTQVTAKTITVNGTPSVQPFSPFVPSGAYTTTAVGGSGYFDGTGDNLTVATNVAFSLASSAFTVEAWVYFTSVSGQRCIVTTYGGATSGWSLQLLTTGFISWGNGDTDLILSTSSIKANQWYHIAVSGTAGTSMRLFINGVQEGSTSTANLVNSSSSLLVAQIASVANLAGYIAGLRVVKGTALYTANFTPPTSPPTNIANTSLLLNFTNAGIVDSTAKNVVETVNSAQISTAQSRFGGSSMLFDGSAPADCLRIPSSPVTSLGSGDWTIEFWVYRVGSGNQIFYDQRSAATQVAVTIFNDGTNVLRFYVNGANRISDTTTFPLTTWTHVAVCKSGSSTRMFVNGTQVGSTYADTNVYVNNPIVIGSQFDQGGGLFNGYIDDLRVTLFARYAANFNVPTIGFTDR